MIDAFLMLIDLTWWNGSINKKKRFVDQLQLILLAETNNMWVEGMEMLSFYHFECPP